MNESTELPKLSNTNSNSDDSVENLHSELQSLNFEISQVNLTNNNENDTLEMHAKDLILMNTTNGARRWRQRKAEYMKKLENENAELKKVIIDLQQKLSAFQAQKDVFQEQLKYFQGCLINIPSYLYGKSETSSPLHLSGNQ